MEFKKEISDVLATLTVDWQDRQAELRLSYGPTLDMQFELTAMIYFDVDYEDRSVELDYDWQFVERFTDIEPDVTAWVYTILNDLFNNYIEEAQSGMYIDS